VIVFYMASAPSQPGRKYLTSDFIRETGRLFCFKSALGAVSSRRLRAASAAMRRSSIGSHASSGPFTSPRSFSAA